MKKQILYVMVLLAGFHSCAQKPVKKEIQKDKQEIAISMKDSLPQYPKEQQFSYIAHMNTKTPYELYLDDILVDWSQTDNFSKSVELNPYLLENGTHTLKIRFFPLEDNEDKIIKPKDIVYDQDVRWNLYFIKLQKDDNDPLGYAGSIDYRNSELLIVPPSSEVPVWEQEFKVEVKDLPYELKGWSKGEDLSKLDQKELEKELVVFYSKLRNLLHEGKITEFMRMYENSFYELSVANYSNSERYNRIYNKSIELLTSECVGNMLPINNYTVRLYGNGRLARLEIPAGKYQHWSVLMSDSKEYGKSVWGIMVYRPKGSKDFVIIRK